MRRHWWLVIVLAVVAVVAAGRAFAFHRRPVVEVTTATISSGPIVRHIVASGTLKAVTTVEVGAQVSGTVQSLAADYNSMVHSGEVVARLDPALFEAAFRQAQAALQEAQAVSSTARADENGSEAAVEDADTKLRRAEQLSLQQLIPQADLDAAQTAMGEATANLQSAESEVTVATAAVEQAQAAVNEARVNLEHTVITSPVDGIVIARNVDVGQTIAAAVATPVMFDIATDLRQLQLEVDIDEADIAGVAPGEAVTFQVESYPDATFGGTISSIHLQPMIEQTGGTPQAAAASATSASATPVQLTSSVTAPSVAGSVVSYATIVDVPNPDTRLRPGMTATVAFTGARRDQALRVPSNALMFRPSLDVLTAVGQPHAADLAASSHAVDATIERLWRYDGARFTPVDVRVGLADRDWTELVGSPLHPGDSVVTSAALRGR